MYKLIFKPLEVPLITTWRFEFFKQVFLSTLEKPCWTRLLEELSGVIFDSTKEPRRTGDSFMTPLGISSVDHSSGWKVKNSKFPNKDHPSIRVPRIIVNQWWHPIFAYEGVGVFISLQNDVNFAEKYENICIFSSFSMKSDARSGEASAPWHLLDIPLFSNDSISPLKRKLLLTKIENIRRNSEAIDQSFAVSYEISEPTAELW